MSRLRSALLSLITTAALLATACGSPESGPSGTSAGSGSSPGPGAPAPKQGGEFKINMGTEPNTIDPNLSNFTTSILVASLSFEGLLSYDKDLKLRPAVAREIPSMTNGGISPDGLTYTFKLRPEAKWSDGRPVKASDFVYAIKRSLDPALAAPYASSLFDIQGAKAYNSALGTKSAPKTASDDELQRLRDAVAVTAPDDGTVVIKLAQARPSFLQLAALWVAWPVREDVITKFGDKWTEPPNYIGNGPFMLQKWDHGTQLEFVPNPNYWGQKPYLDKLTLVQIADANQAFLAYQNDDIQSVGVPDANVALVQNDPRLSQEALRFNELTIFGYEFNTTSPPLDNVKVRQALATAVDRKALIEKVAQGVGQVAYSPVPPGMPGHDPEAGKEFDFNVQKAKQLLADAGYSDISRFPRLNFTFTDTSANRLRAEFFQAQMKQNLGIDVVLEPLDGATYQSRFNASQFQIAFGGWGADYPDPDNFVPELFATGSGNNHTNYSNPQVDAQAKACQSELDESKRLAACAQAQRLVVADQPWAFAFYRERFWLVKPYVQGFQYTAKDQLPGNRFYNYIWINR